jgi:hypothetical protein
MKELRKRGYTPTGRLTLLLKAVTDKILKLKTGSKAKLMWCNENTHCVEIAATGSEFVRKGANLDQCIGKVNIN